jgi:hypothetical protein
MEQLTILSDDLAALSTAVLEKPRSRQHPPNWWRRARQSRASAALNSFPSRVFLLALAFYLTLTCLHLWLIGSPAARQPAPAGLSLIDWAAGFTATWRRFDSYFFLHIAQHGYTDQGLGAFFPLYPLLVRLFAWPLAGHFTLAALLVSWLCAWGSYLCFFRLAHREFGARVARFALLFLALSPVSFFAFAPYSEALFLLVSISAVERARAGRLWQAGLLAALGMLTRPTGILLLIPLAWECGRHSPAITRLVSQLKQADTRRFHLEARREAAPKDAPGGSASHEAPPRLGRRVPSDGGGAAERLGGSTAPLRGVLGRGSSWLSLGLAPLALSGYMLFLQLHNHNALAFLAGESAWHRHFTLPWDTVGLFAIAFQQTWQAGEYTALLGNVVDVLLVVLLPALVLYSAMRRKRLWLGAALYQLALTLMLIIVPNVPAPATGEEVLLSTQRFMLPAFPIFLLLGQLGIRHPRLSYVLLIASSGMLLFNTWGFLGNVFIA